MCGGEYNINYNTYCIITFDIHEFGSRIDRLSTSRDDAQHTKTVRGNHIFYIAVSSARRVHNNIMDRYALFVFLRLDTIVERMCIDIIF